MKTSEIIKDVMQLLGEPGGCIPEGTGAGGWCSPEGRILMEIEEKAAQAILAVPPERLDGWRLLPDDGMTVDEEGVARLPLPADFLLLHSLRMSDWERPVAKVLPHSHWLRALCGSRWHGLRGVPSRPLAFFGIADGEGGSASRCLLLYSSRSPQATLAEGWYMPAPRIGADDTISVPVAARPVMLRLLAESVAATSKF